MSNISPGYCGIAYIDGTYIRCTDFGVVPEQNPLFYDHVIGLRDTIPTDDSTKGEGPDGVIQLQKTVERPSVKIVTGGFSFPISEDIGDFLFKHAKYGTEFDIEFTYTAGEISRKFKKCKISSYVFSITSGDIATISVNVMGIDVEDGGGLDRYRTPKKLITWDEIYLDLPSVITGTAQSFEFTINNNLIPIYTNVQNLIDLKPIKIRVGIQEVTGTITVYGKEPSIYDSNNPITLQLAYGGNFSTNILAILQSRKPTGAIGPVLTTIPFVGVDRPFGS